MNRPSPHSSFNGPCPSVDEERGLRCGLSGDHAKCVFTVPVDAVAPAMEVHTIQSLAMEMYEADSAESEGAIGVADRIDSLNESIRLGSWTAASTADWNRVRPGLGDRIAAYVEGSHRKVTKLIEAERARIVEMARNRAESLQHKISHTVPLWASACDRLVGARDALRALANDIEAGK